MTAYPDKLPGALRLWLVIGALVCVGSAMNGDGIDEYRVKAAFLYNFAKFVDWPPEAFRGSTDPISICVLGDKTFASRLALVVGGQTVGTRSLTVREVSNVQGGSHCQILFISDSEWKRARADLRRLGEAPVLTVGESDQFVESGGVINFKLKNEHIRIEIGPGAASRAKLHISAKLLSLADTVHGSTEGGR